MLTTIFGGKLAERMLRNRGRLRAMSAAILEWEVRRKYALIKDGKWSPPAPEVVSDIPLSLTSWHKRFDKLHYTLLSLVQQTTRPREIMLWISREDYGLLPDEILPVFGPLGVRVQACDDLRSHKKWLPFIEHGEEGRFVICDDDILYPPNWFASLIQEDRDDAYVGTKCHRIVWRPDGSPAPYAQWQKQIEWDGVADESIFITGCGGAIVYPSRIERWFRARQNIFDKCPGADDVWLKAAHAAAGFPSYKTRYSFPCLEVSGSVTTGLAQENVINRGNDAQISKVEEFLHSRCGEPSMSTE